MKKLLLLGCMCCWMNSAFASFESLPQDYQNFKNWLQKKTGLSYSIDVSFLPQRGAPNGKVTPWQSQYYGSATWDMFSSDIIGSGSLQASYTAVRYWGASANTLGNNIGVISSVNDYPSNTNNFDELSYTHTLPGKLNSLAFTIGQFPMYNFDGTDYDSNQQINFLNFALSQNGSSVYPTASLGGFVSWNPNSTWSFTIGGQNANNITGETISWSQFEKGKWTSFVSGTWSPTIAGLAGQYSITLYDQPSVIKQPIHTRGWSFNVQQFIFKKIALFGRVNGTNKSLSSIKQSYVLGGVYNNPLNRNSLDQIGFAAAINKLNQSVNGSGTRSWENVLEGYIAVGVSDFMTITPDIQFYINPGANQKSNTATVVSLRATMMF